MVPENFPLKQESSELLHLAKVILEKYGKVCGIWILSLSS